MIDHLKTMPVEEFQTFLDRLELMDSSQAAAYLKLSPATLRNPKNKYKKLGVKIGQYWFWRRGVLAELIKEKADGNL